MSQLRTDARITWCPGCGNYQILNAMEHLLNDMQEEGFPLEKVILVSGIGNHAKIVDYLHVNSFNALHGRAIPAAQAIKQANPEMRVICFVGDGDSYAEGLEHLLFAAKRNVDMTVIVHNNRTYGLATGQFTPTSQKGFTGVTMPEGAKEESFNPLELLLAAGASFIARSYTREREHFRRILKEAITHPGFALVDALQVCITFNNLYETYNEKVHEITVNDPANYMEALAAIRQWGYDSSEGPIPAGVFYKKERPAWEKQFNQLDRSSDAFKGKRQVLIDEYTAPLA
jgi:2-oxoglutarate/2-oxoacid ferredoxin oxidoreductase subunit beta